MRAQHDDEAFDLAPAAIMQMIANVRAFYRAFRCFYVEPRDVAEATTLMDTFGPKAGMEAAERAVQSRNVGNHLHYCRWRQIERLIIMLSAHTTLGTIH